MSSNTASLVAQLVALGIEESMAGAAVAASGGITVDAAMEVLFSVNDSMGLLPTTTEPARHMNRYKMTVVVNMSLGMSPGKLSVCMFRACVVATELTSD